MPKRLGPKRLGPKRLGAETSRGRNGLVPKRLVTPQNKYQIPFYIGNGHSQFAGTEESAWSTVKFLNIWAP